ncbi:hypothetical protein MPL3365_140175 [Mesorhizobium plurifarium]|uniref:Uncharacterized protein n=1 Tax=Mesorhizobium plurifarium TaxID=69974 RepID=A0A090GT38_MESPL|nr:hypothetical protein MPL3365_140175 [Mesorhizobium plurifarium]
MSPMILEAKRPGTAWACWVVAGCAAYAKLDKETNVANAVVAKMVRIMRESPVDNEAHFALAGG